ncbi:branched-chain amino acid ABC transporter permease [Enterovirga rhinocerotis]|uniref:Branched-chain amino acid transport system permease protein n=1 Tax=Enterovirga rhinocerotis TaxID=1339210 RepID=A0A4R7BMX6_9HYPH|nr:branched-chain amino acid ABC transporter permease [Enterovirga rhinocerotis]TDR85267.1 branched-chain amino acid transport system permease protein [Enterovirga rhinocerotis]
MLQVLIGAAAAALAALPFLASDAFLYHVAILIGIEALLALSLHLTLRIGQLSLAQAAFMGMGAYASALLTRDLSLPFPAAFLAAVLIPAAIAAVLGTVILKVRGVHFALLTFVLGQAVVLIFVEFVVPFGGNNGLMRIPGAEIAGLPLQSRPAFYALTLVVLGAAFAVVARLVRGETGRILDGLAANEALTQSLGIDALAWRRLVFAVSGGVAGAAGSLYAHYLGYISPEAFGITATINALIMNVVGGVALLAGPLIGAVILVPLPELFRSALLYQQLFYGLSLLALMLFMPRGLGGLVVARRHAR